MTRTSPRVVLYPPAMDDLDDMRVATDSDDELNIIQSVQKDLGHEDYIKSAPLSTPFSSCGLTPPAQES